MTLEIVHYGKSILHETGDHVTSFDEALKQLFDEMVKTMHREEGIGLAAQQIGRKLQFCVVDLRGYETDFDYTIDGATPPLDLLMPIGMCNPKVETIESEVTTYEEGCLSFPEIKGDVDRPDWIRCAYQDIEGNPHTITCNGILGRCIQHEVDHLNGILFIDRMKKKVLKKIQVAVNQLKAKTILRTSRNS